MRYLKITIGLFLVFGMVAIAVAQKQSAKENTLQSRKTISQVLKAKKESNSVLLTCTDGCMLKVNIVRDDIIRFQASLTNRFESSLPIELGFVKDDFPVVPFVFDENSTVITISTSLFTLEIQKSPFTMRLIDKEGHLITQLDSSEGIKLGNQGNQLTFQMPNDEHFYGFGYMRSCFDARGKKLTWKRDYRWNEATVPYFMSTRNYAFYSNNTWDHVFDFTSENSNQNENFTIENNGGALDFYLLVGKDFKELLNTYTDLTGKSLMPPKWSYGLSFRCRVPDNQEAALALAKKFRECDIPIDIMALEPGWESKYYGDTWEWHSGRFPDPKGMISEMNKMGYHFDLWDSGMAPTKNILDESVRKSWYNRRAKIIEMGVDMFKQDDPYPRSIHSESYDPAIMNKYSLATEKYKHQELRNIANSIYSETAFNEFRKLTGKRYATQFHAYNASIASHRWPYQWGGDFTAGNGMLNAGLSGHALSSEDMRDYSPKGLHHDYLTPVPVLDAWAYYREPWLFSGKVESDHRFYARFRQKLSPYFYSSVWQSHTRALPLMRPMIMEFQNDRNTLNMTGEYMLGEWLLVIAETSSIDEFMGTDFTKRDYRKNSYLPAGKWINYWTGEVYRVPVGQNYNVEWPDYAGGALLVKSGAIIPVGRANSYTDETPYEVVNLEIYPDKSSSYTLYEDDGNSYDYETGRFCTTTFYSAKNENLIRIKSDERKGSYKTMPENRAYFLKVFSELPPSKVMSLGEELPQFTSKEDLIYESAKGWFYDEVSKKVFVKTDSNWKMVKNTKRQERNNVMDMELDDVLFTGKTPIHEAPLDVQIELDLRPLVEARFSENNLHADGISKTFLYTYFKDVPGAKTFDSNASATITIDGPATFENGKRSISLMSVLHHHIPVYVSTETGIVRIITSDNVRLLSKELVVSGDPAIVVVKPLQSVLLADGVSRAAFRVELKDKENHSAIPAVRSAKIHVMGEGQIPAGKDTITLINGIGTFEIISTKIAGSITVSAEVDNMKSEECKLMSVKGKLNVTTNPPEELVFFNGTYVTWKPTKADVIVRLTVDGKTIACSTRPVTIKVLDIDRKLKNELTSEIVNGEAIFAGVDYYSRPGKCYFVISSEGYDDVELKIFENTWEK